MSVKLKKRQNSSGTTSLYLEIYIGGKRRCEFLNELKLLKPISHIEKAYNKNCLELANQVMVTRAKEIFEQGYDLKRSIGRRLIICDWMQGYIAKYKKKDVRNLRNAVNKFRIFLDEEGKANMLFGELNEQHLVDFQDYLNRICKGEGASSYFNRFKKILRVAFREGVINKDYAASVKTKIGIPREKDVLTSQEIELLYNTPVSNTEVKRAFLLCCMTGLRWVDVKFLKWSHVDFKENFIKKSQEKTQREVEVTLNSAAVKLLGQPEEDEKSVFRLPSQDGANKTLGSWVKKAGIKKKITWHCARHTFGTLLVYNNTDINTTANLLGHTSLKYITRYVKTVKDQKERATNKLDFNTGI